MPVDLTVTTGKPFEPLCMRVVGRGHLVRPVGLLRNLDSQTLNVFVIQGHRPDGIRPGMRISARRLFFTIWPMAAR